MIELRKYIIEVPAKLNIKSTTNIQIVLLEALRTVPLEFSELH